MALAVLFDLDGTLLDHDAASRAAVTVWARSLLAKPEADDDELCGEWSRLEAEHFPRYLDGSLTFSEQRRARVRAYLAYLGLPAGLDAHVDMHFSDYLRRYEDAWTAYPDARTCLDRLARAGLSTGLLTNGQEDQQRAKLHRVGLDDCFQVVVTSSMLPRPKPAPEAFLTACERLGQPPSDVVYVGDNLATDALAAHAVGLRGVWLDRHGVGTSEESVRTIGDLHQLAALVLKER